MIALKNELIQKGSARSGIHDVTIETPISNPARVVDL